MTEPQPLLPSGQSFAPIDPARDDEAAAILAAATYEGTIERARARLTERRADPACTVYGLSVDGVLVAAYVLCKSGMANEVVAIAVAAEQRGKGYGRACLQDALRRSGRRPLVAETDDDAIGFYKACGFKLVGRRTRPDGGVRYRLGWHAPGLRTAVPGMTITGKEPTT